MMRVPVQVTELVIWGTVEEDVEHVKTVGVDVAAQGVLETDVTTDWIDEEATQDTELDGQGLVDVGRGGGTGLTQRHTQTEGQCCGMLPLLGS